MSKTRWALLLLLSIGALLAFLLVLFPRRPVGVGEAGAARESPSTGGAGPAPENGVAREGGTAREAEPAGGAGPAYPVPEKEPLPLVEPRVAARPLPEGREARMAIVIDDVGYSLKGLEQFLALPFPLAFSVLPDLPHSREAGRLIAAAGKELLVHLPMEPSSGTNPGPGAVLTSQSDEEIRQLLEGSLERLPQAVGLNNHMGSLATADRRVMGVVLEFLRARGLFFLDSRTTADTLGPELAGRMGVSLLERTVFLDNENSAAYIEAALQHGVRAARLRGSAVLIGHVQNVELADELRRLLPGLAAEGVRLVAPSVLAADGRGGP
jgi:polysaccharide deacetylase 2 family uncharacterized protein YibQ